MGGGQHGWLERIRRICATGFFDRYIDVEPSRIEWSIVALANLSKGRTSVFVLGA
jgi:hypothetical protein